MSGGKELPQRARAVIVGGGVTGCSIAYHLAHLGWTDIVLLEQHELTAGTTWHAAGLITSAGMTDETALFLSRYSRDLYERLEKETGHSTGFNPVGHVSLATNSGYGAWVLLQHADGTVTRYGHINSWTVQVGQRVFAGDQIATIGNRGNSTGPHLHFSVLLGGSNPTDPAAWLASRGISIGAYIG